MHKILFKYASRGRPQRFFDGLRSIYDNLSDLENFHVACTLDFDDPTMQRKEIIQQILSYRNTSIQWGISKNKIHAINRDIPNYPWDILVAMSDDMRMSAYAFDIDIRNAFGDGLDWHVHFPDQDEKDKLPVLYIAGRPFFERFNWIYNPIYESLFCDTELMHIAKAMGLYKYVDTPGLFRHLLPAYGHLPADEMWTEQQRIGWSKDFETFNKRQSRNFDLLTL